jgi:hemolysin activation/secretion protein
VRQVALAAALACALCPAGSPAEEAPAPKQRPFDLLELRVEGCTQFTNRELEELFAPYLGPGKVLGDLERARRALEKAYSDKGIQTATVAIPPQRVKGGVVTLKATEGRVGRLRVVGARYFSPSDVRRLSPSMAEGAVPNFNAMIGDLVALNGLPDRRVTPALRPGALPGTIDVDLNVQDKLPLHGQVEFNNRYSPNTTRQRLNLSARYENLWQEGHTLNLSFQTAPRNTSDALVFSASYLARFSSVPWLSLTGSAVVQNSDISTLGSFAVRGRGRIFGLRAGFTLPSSPTFFQSVSVGLDLKSFGQEIAEDPNASPIQYWPATFQYAALFNQESSQASLSFTLLVNLRAFGSGPEAYDARRYLATGSFSSLRIEGNRLQELWRGFQLSGRIAAQYSFDSLIPSEQLTAGGADSVRGYVEAQAAGDAGFAGAVELRSPLLLPSLLREARLLAFFDGGRVHVHAPGPEQQRIFLLWSCGPGLRARLGDWLSGGFDLGIPLRSEGTTQRYTPRGHFRLSGEF